MITNVTATENFFKFAFLSGMFLVVFGIVYPIERSNDLEFKKAEHQAEVNRINYQISKLRERLDSMEYYEASYMEAKKDTTVSDITLDRHLRRFDENYLLFERRQGQVEVATIKSEGEKSKIAVLENHIKEFGTWQVWLISIGSVFILIGGIYWCWMTLFDFKQRRKNT